MSEGRFAGRSVLITGAASGFGALAARLFAAEGARLTLSDIDEAALGTLAGELGAEWIRCDVSREADVAGQVALALDRHGALDVAINNAGVGHLPQPITRTKVDEFDRMMAINARGVFLGLKHQLPPMIEAGGGAILNVASAAGLVGAGHLAAYAASKHAVVGLTRAAADEVARHGVRVNALCPSFASTPLFDEMADALAARQGTDREAAYGRIASRVPMRRVARPEEVVPAMLWICDPANSFMTGQAIAVDGGLTAV
jgi:NAD(P)-dependent dehydrogenase (short-subunit alcohol dehydrogenase family)